MILDFIERFQEIKPELVKEFSKNHPNSYEDIFRKTIKMMFEDYENEEICDSDLPDFERITVIDDGDWQGTLVFVVGAQNYQPSTYWVSSVNYGSCSVCDTFKEYEDFEHPEKSAPNMVTLALHLIQSLKEI